MIFAYVAIGVYDSVMAVEGGYRPFAVKVDAPEGASAEAAVAAAAHRILAHYLPAQAPTILDPAYAASLSTISDEQAKTDGIAVGEEVAARLIAKRAGDGFRAPVTYTPPSPPIPGVWLPTAPTPPIGTYLGLMEPFSLASADQYRPEGPPALSSNRWAREYNEVKEIGSSTSTTRSAEQTLAARFWAEPPVQQARGSFRRFVLGHDLDVVQASRFMAMISVVYADALIACFDAKYHYAFWRPITAIRAGDTDGNAATVGDPAWSPLLPGTPNHPEYPSAHSCITPAGGRVIAEFLGTQDQLHRPQPDRASVTATTLGRATSSTKWATPASGAASTTAPPSRTESRSASGPSTRCSPTTSSGRHARGDKRSGREKARTRRAFSLSQPSCSRVWASLQPGCNRSPAPSPESTTEESDDHDSHLARTGCRPCRRSSGGWAAIWGLPGRERKDRL